MPMTSSATDSQELCENETRSTFSSMNNTHYSCSIGNETVTVSTNAPAFLIVGTQKGGTSSLLKLLKRHPDISVGRGKRKIEVHYFDKLAEFREEREQSVRQQHNLSTQEEVNYWHQGARNSRQARGKIIGHFHIFFRNLQ